MLAIIFKISDHIPDKEIVNDYGRTIHTVMDSDGFEFSGYPVTRYELLDVPLEELTYGNIVHANSDTLEMILNMLKQNIAKA